MSSPTPQSATPKYQAIVFDLDGTAIENARDAMPSERLIATIAAAQSHIHLIAATGRPMNHALPIIEALGIIKPCVISGGAIIYDPLTSRTLQHTPLTPRSLQTLIEIAREHPAYSFSTRDEYLSSDKDSARTPLQDTEIAYLARVPGPEVNALKQRLAAIPDISANPVPDWAGGNQFAFNITHINATKEHAVATVLEQLGVPRKHAIGIGDGDNDIHLFASVGLKIAMGNAGPLLKSAANLIAPSVHDDGLAQIIEQYSI